jgi:hypothetical protein
MSQGKEAIFLSLIRWSIVFDLNLYPLHIKNSIEYPDLPGLLMLTADKKSPRIRIGDLLVILLTLPGEQVDLYKKCAEFVENAARDYLRSAGTVTAGMKVCAEAINQKLLDHNVMQNHSDGQVAGLLNMAVIRENRAYIAHCGYTHSFALSKTDTDHLFDPEISGRGLGITRLLNIRFFLKDLKEGEYLLFSPEPLSSWTPSNLNGSASMALEYIRRRLLNQVSPNIRALLLQVTPGTGKINLQAALSQHNRFIILNSKTITCLIT